LSGPGHNFNVAARSLLTSTINPGLPRDFNELRVAKISRFATSALTAGNQPLSCMAREPTFAYRGKPLQSHSIQLCACRISDAADPIKPLLREDIFLIRRRMPSAARQSSIRRSLQRNAAVVSLASIPREVDDSSIQVTSWCLGIPTKPDACTDLKPDTVPRRSRTTFRHEESGLRAARS
jgi:hypothetical protein